MKGICDQQVPILEEAEPDHKVSCLLYQDRQATTLQRKKARKANG